MARRKRMVLFGVLLEQALYEQIEEARGDCPRDEWMAAAAEALMVRTDLQRRYMGYGRQRRKVASSRARDRIAASG